MAEHCICSVLQRELGYHGPACVAHNLDAHGRPLANLTTDDEFGITLDPCEHPSINGGVCAVCGVDFRCTACGAEGFRLTNGCCDGCNEAAR